ncbi:MAG: T9SS type A sorting domain-containing protein [Thermoanaerobaculia bacterium]|nr:T9SS type A sorting domain-containing protein [Thermoanaerobaculia bacterium]
MKNMPFVKHDLSPFLPAVYATASNIKLFFLAGLVAFCGLSPDLHAQVNISSVSFPQNKTVHLKRICSGANCDGDCLWTSAELSFELTVSPAHSGDTIKKIEVTAPNGVNTTIFDGNSTKPVVKDIKVPNKFLTCPGTDTWTYHVSVDYKIASSDKIVSGGKESFTYHFACEKCPEKEESSIKTTGNDQSFVPESPFDQWVTVQFSILNLSHDGGMDLILPRLRLLQPFEEVIHLEPVMLAAGRDTTMLVPILIPAGTAACTVFHIALEAEYASAKGAPGLDMITIGVMPAEAPEVKSEVRNVTCPGFSDGSAAVFIADDPTLYKVIWENGHTGFVIEGLPAGAYCARIMDEKECVVRNLCLPVYAPEPITLTTDQITGTVPGLFTGSIRVSVSGGAPPYYFLWTDENGQIVGETEDVEGLAPGNYTLQVTDANECPSLLQTFQVPALVSAKERLTPELFRLFPNPTDGRVWVEIGSAQATERTVFILTDVAGRVCRSGEIIFDGMGGCTLDLDGLPAGLYLLRLSVGNAVSVRQVVLNKF